MLLHWGPEKEREYLLQDGEKGAMACTPTQRERVKLITLLRESWSCRPAVQLCVGVGC